MPRRLRNSGGVPFLTLEGRAHARRAGPQRRAHRAQVFRRVAKWKEAQPNADAFLAWLKAQDDGKKLVAGATPRPVALYKLFEKVSKTEVAVPYDVTRLWFSE